MPTAKATPGRKAPIKAPAHPPLQRTDEVVKSQPRSVEVRIDGKVRFANLCYDPHFEVSDQTVTFTADLNPTWIERALPAPTRFVEQEDPRDGGEVIMKVHSGRRDVAESEEQS
jgi:hypothetical protein